MPERNKKIYCFDSSAFIDSWRRYYPPVVFSSLWDQFSELIKAERLIVPKEVEKEIKTGNDELYNWFKQNKSCVQGYTNKQLEVVSEIVNKYPKVSQYHRPRPNHADPFVVALAKIEKCIVVTWEGLNNSSINPAIPDLCREYNIEFCNPIGLFEKEKWTFNHSFK